MIEDTPTTRVTINEMTLEDLDAELDALRTRRLSLSAKLVQMSQIKRTNHITQAHARFDKGRERVKKQVDKLTEATLKIETELNKLRALILEVEDLE